MTRSISTWTCFGRALSYRELAEHAWKIPDRFYDRRYPSIIHGVGLHGETPLVAHQGDFDKYSKGRRAGAGHGGVGGKLYR